MAVNGEDVNEAPRDHVIQLVRSCEREVSLLVCQPTMSNCPGRKSTLLSAGKRAKLRTRPSRVRFAESVCVNGAPLFPVSYFPISHIFIIVFIVNDKRMKIIHLNSDEKKKTDSVYLGLAIFSFYHSEMNE